MFKVKETKVKVTECVIAYNVSPANNRYISRTDKLAVFKFCENYTGSEVKVTM